MDYTTIPEIIGEPLLKLDGKINFSKKEKREAWEFAIGINQLDGEWIPGAEYMDLVEKEINGEITTQEIREILNKKYTLKYKVEKS